MQLLELLVDVAGLTSSVGLTPILLAVLFLVSWQEFGDGPRFGFDQRTFWLLFVGGIVGSLANLPIFAYDGSILAVNLGGALFPVLVSLGILWRARPGSPRTLLLPLAGIAGGSAVVLFLEVATGSDVGPLVVTGLFALFGALVAAVTLGSGSTSRADRGTLLLAYVLVAGAVVGTYLTTSVAPGVGIISLFPLYLISPAVVGVAAVGFRPARSDGPGFAYATATLGVLVGADVLHQPALYASPFLGAIGGAGINDLVYLSGPLALTVGLLVERLFHGPAQTRPVPSPGSLQEAWRAFEDGRYAEVPLPVVRALETTKADLARDLRSLSPPAVPNPGEGAPLPPPPWMEADLENLRSLAARPPNDRREAWRALAAATFLRAGYQALWAPHLGSAARRAAGFLIDLALTMAIPLALLGLWVGGLPVSAAGGLANSIPFNAAVFAIGSAPFLVFVAFEVRTGTTPGKRWLGLRVVRPGGGPPDLWDGLVRNVPKLIPLNAIALGTAVGLLLVPAGAGPLGVASALLGTIIVAGIPCGVGFLLISASPRRQRLGDLLARTWVIREIPRRPQPPAPQRYPLPA